MSILSIQIGQCGNQLGAEFFQSVCNDCLGQKARSSLDRDYVSESVSTFFHEARDGVLESKCVQVDMEEKVITRLRKANTGSRGWRYPDGNSYMAKGGSGNNWAYGFFVNAAHIEDKVEAPLQRMLERCDYLDGVLVSMSLAGGTGSGVGTQLLLNMPDLLPKTPTLVQLVWPYCRGEVSVQAYNTVLTLGHLLSTETAVSLDGFLMHHNDALHASCSQRLLASNPNSPIGIDQLNALAAHQLAGLLQPYETITTQGNTMTSTRRLSSLLSSLCGHPDYRLLRSRCLPYFGPECREFATDTWAQLARHGRQMLLTGSAVEDNLDWSSSSGSGASRRLQQTRLPLLGCLAILRGSEADHLVREPEAVMHDLTRSLFDRASPSNHTVVGGHTRAYCGYPRALFLATNGGGMRPSTTPTTECVDIVKATASIRHGDTLACLKYATGRAWEMFASKAYLHQYARYGLDTELLMDCFASVEQAAHCYATLPWTEG